LSRGESREKFLRLWLKKPFPLAYGEQDGNEVFKLLVQAISEDDHSVTQGLPNWKTFGTMRGDLAVNLFDMSKPRRALSPKAPVVRNGSFLPVLKVAHESLIDLATNMSVPEAPNEFVTGVLFEALKIFKVQYFPAPKPKTGTAGAPNTKPLYNSWGHLGRREMREHLTENPSSQASSGTVSPATVAFNNATASDCNVDWAANELDLTTLKRYIDKMSLPTDFALSSSKSEYVNNTYRWVSRNYDGRKPVHHLALLVGVIVASTLLPNLFMPLDAGSLFINAISTDDVRKTFEEIDWEPRARRGMADKSIFIGMFTTLIISLYEKESPLRRHMSSAPKHGLGDGWTAKHSKLLASHIHS
jgi:hypothetical protein